MKTSDKEEEDLGFFIMQDLWVLHSAGLLDDGDGLILQLDGRCCELNAAARAASSAAAGTAALKPASEPCAQR